MDNDNSFDVHIMPNKVNLLVAPNGFGKSSIAKGFKSLNANRLDLPDDLYHDKTSPIIPEISMVYAGNTLVADKNRNTISSEFDVTVINSGLIATSQNKSFQGRTISKGVLEVEDIVLRTSIPQAAHIKYSITKFRKRFGDNGKILTNLSENLAKEGVADKIRNLYPQIEVLHKGYPKICTKKIIEQLNLKKGSATKIVGDLDSHLFDELEAIKEYQDFQNEIKSLKSSDSAFDRFELFIQIKWLYEYNRQNLLEVQRYEQYINLRNKYNEIIKAIDTTGRDLQAKEVDGKLIVSFPKADTISNGQRDIVTFIINLVKFQMRYDENKKQLLIIDEVFDYLDDANVVAAQYFLSNLLKKNKENLYLVIFSHITEEHFRGWVLNKKLNTQYIKPIQAKASSNTKAFIAYREYLKANKSEHYPTLSNYYFHYNPQTSEQDLSAAYIVKDGLKQNWFKGTYLHQAIIPELNKYLSGQEQYDPYAVCFALRFACEKNIYEQLRTEEEKDTFLAQNTTTKKLNWAEDAGYSVPIIYYLLGIIFNEAEHITGYEMEKNKERSCVYRLDNGAIRQMAIKLFHYKGEDITVDAIVDIV